MYTMYMYDYMTSTSLD